MKMPRKAVLIFNYGPKPAIRAKFYTVMSDSGIPFYIRGCFTTPPFPSFYKNP